MDAPAYVTVADANAYLTGRPNSKPWDDATPDQRLGALREASDRLDEMMWVGLPLVKGQARVWPRSGVDASSINVVRRATILEAVALLTPQSERQKLQAEGVTSFRLGSLSETYGEVKESAGGLNSASAYKILSPYFVRSGRVV